MYARNTLGERESGQCVIERVSMVEFGRIE